MKKYKVKTADINSNAETEDDYISGRIFARKPTDNKAPATDENSSRGLYYVI